MKPFLRLLPLLASLAGLPALADTTETGQPPCLDQRCLLCPAALDADKYQGASMRMMQHIALGKDAWLFRSRVDLDNDFGIPAEMQAEYARLIRAFKARGSDVMFAVQPTRGLMHRDKLLPDQSYGFDYPRARANLARFLEQLRAGGARVPDMLQLVDQPPAEEYFFRRDSHWSPAGARATAQRVAEDIRALPYYPQLAKKRFRSEPGVTIVNYGVMDMALRHLCFNDFGNQYLRGYRTVPEADDAAALFDEQPEPEVVLVGTSNSAARDEEIRHFNFDGYLKEFTELDILNYAMQGAGQYGALLEYLLSGDYDPAKAPKLLVWELPASYRLDSPAMYRQLIPAINGGCSASPRRLMKQQSSLPALQPGQRVEILNNAGAQRQELTGLQGFVELQLSDRNLRDFYLITYYDNGDRDKIRVRRPAVVSGGRYHLELSRDARFNGANLLSVLLEPNVAMSQPSTVDVQLCQ